MKHLSHILPYGLALEQAGAGRPCRKSLIRPVDRGLFVMPLRQSFITDPRLSSGAMRCVALLAGWSGAGGPIETTQGILARHLGRSVRQIYRYLQDAMEEGYLFYARTVNRMGYITGVRIWINAATVRRKNGAPVAKRAKQSRETRRNPARTLMADTKHKSSLVSAKDRETERAFADRLEAIAARNGFALRSGGVLTSHDGPRSRLDLPEAALCVAGAVFAPGGDDR